MEIDFRSNEISERSDLQASVWLDEIKQARAFPKPSNERVIDIDDADETFGWWQKKEFEKLGVEKIKLEPDGAELQLKKAIRKNAIVTSLDIAKSFSFDFTPGSKSWSISNINGLKVDGIAVDRAEATERGIRFYSGNDKREYGRSAMNFIRALLDPLMREDLRR